MPNHSRSSVDTYVNDETGERIDVPDPWYLAYCRGCGWHGSSEQCGTEDTADTGCCGDVYCPKCGEPGCDEDHPDFIKVKS